MKTGGQRKTGLEEERAQRRYNPIELVYPGTRSAINAMKAQWQNMYVLRFREELQRLQLKLTSVEALRRMCKSLLPSHRGNMFLFSRMPLLPKSRSPPVLRIHLPRVLIGSG